MKISFHWLQRHVDLSGLTPQDVVQDLTIHTAEVEGLERFAPHLAEVVVGHVVERAKHPDADKLSVCKVDVGARGEGQLLQIVCGAANVAQGQKVAVALPGGRTSSCFETTASQASAPPSGSEPESPMKIWAG